MAKAKPKSKTRHTVKIDLPGLIRLLAKSLYAESDVFIREMIQNAHDSIQKRSDANGDQIPGSAIRIVADHAARTLSFIDNGCGMTESEVHDYLATIGRSGTDEFRKKLLDSGRHMEATVIGRFGIGLLSAFVAARRVVVETKSIVHDTPSCRWVSEGQSEYDLVPGSRSEPGTTVTLDIAPEYLDMLDETQLVRAVKKYADFIPVGIFINNSKLAANAIDAPWHKSYASDDQRLAEYWSFASRRFPDLPLEVIPVEITGSPRCQGIMYISDQHLPDIASAGLVDVYQARMFIAAGNRDLLPSWAKFIRGVIDSPDLSPTAARDAIQQDSASRTVRERLGEVIVAHLTGLAVRDPRKTEKLLELHAYHVKGMAVQHDDFFDAICDLVPFETNRGPMTLRKYLDQSPRIFGQRTIHYFDERGSATQFYMLCNAKSLLVVNASNVFEQPFLQKYADRHASVRTHLIGVAGSDFLFESLKPEAAQAFRALERDFETTMPHPHSQARTVRFAPATLPAVTVLSKEGQAQQKMKEMAESVVVPEFVKKIMSDVLGDKPSIPVVLQLNADNPTVQQLARMSGTPLALTEEYKVAVLAAYNNAILLAQHMMTPENAQAAFASSNRSISLLIEQTEKFKDTQARLTALELRLRELEDPPATPNETNESPDRQRRHVVCFASLPFKDDETFPFSTVLLPALQRVLEQEPYFWQVLRADERYQGVTVEENVGNWLRRADAYIADISTRNANVMMELGFMQWAESVRSRPRIVLEREGMAHPLPLWDLGSFIKVTYPQANAQTAGDDHAIKELAEVLAGKFEKLPAIQELNGQKGAHYLSAQFLYSDCEIARARAALISKKFVTMEALVEAEVADILAKIPGITEGRVSGLKLDVANRLKALRSQQ